MKSLRALALLGLAWLAICPVVSAAPPNVVLIISDDQAWTDYSFMGHPAIHTPNLDRLAAQGLTFTRGYVPASLCCPSLAAMITGQYPHQNKVTSNDPPVPKAAEKGTAEKGTAKKGAAKKAGGQQKSKEFTEGREVMNQHMDAAATMPRLLVQNGYLALQTGKWWQGNFTRGGFTHGMTKGSRHGDEGLDIGRKTMQPIYDFIGEAKQAKKPFFLWYAPMMPHDPHTPPERILAKYRGQTPSEHVAKYWAMCEWFDETVGDLLKHLDEQGVADNTIVLFTTDNGWIQDPEKPRYAAKSKQSQYDGGLRSPILVRWPAKVKPQKSDSLATTLDFLPTVLAAAGIKAPANLPGVNLLDASAVQARKAIYGECFTHNSMDLYQPAASLRWRWMVEGDYKLIVPAPQNQPDDQTELYHLATDKSEERNLAESEKARVETMRKKLDAWWPGKL